MPVEGSTRESGKKIRSTGGGWTSIRTGSIMRANGERASSMAKAYTSIKMEISIEATGSITTGMAKAYSLLITLLFIKANGQMIILYLPTNDIFIIIYSNQYYFYYSSSLHFNLSIQHFYYFIFYILPYLYDPMNGIAPFALTVSI